MNRSVVSKALLLVAIAVLTTANKGTAQSLGNAGTVQGSITDPSGAALPGAKVTAQNPVSGYTQTVTSGANGAFRLLNLPTNTYHVMVSASGFAPVSEDVVIRSSLPIGLNLKLKLASTGTTVEVESAGQDLIEADTSAHIDVDRSTLAKLPTFDPAGSLSQAIIYTTGGVAADGNGFFHPLGDHAQTTFVIDGQPISDQQSKVFSTQLPTSAIQNMQLITGAPQAEFGDKSSLVAQITTRSGLGAMQPFGSVSTYYGTFGSVGGDVSLGVGNERFGNFIALDGTRSGRFLDTPEFSPFHDKGNNQTIFDRLDFQPSSKDVLHLDLFAARNWIQIPNSFDQLGQDQVQRVLTWNIAAGYQRTLSPNYLLTVNPYIRKDEFNYYPSRDLLSDTPSTQQQHRKLLNYGIKSDLAINQGHHNIKIGIDLKQTRLLEEFAFGITDPTYNSPCVDSLGGAITDPTLLDPNVCGNQGYTANPNLQPGLLPYDLSRGGGLFTFRAKKNINQYAAYVEDSITLGNFLITVGLRGDTYYGLVQDSAASPRAGLAYTVKKTNTVLRGAYSRTFETPFNENLLLSSASGLSNGQVTGVLGVTSANPIPVGKRNQYNVGFQQAVGKYLLIDADYFWKYTNNAYDFSTLQNTTITFPIAWAKSKLDGVTGRVSTTNIHGFQAYWTVGHTRARYFPDQTGGLLNTSIVPPGVFRIDHDQALQSTVLARYQRPHNAEWVSLAWRYDSGLVVSGVADVAAALALTPNQQVTIGFACDGVLATVSAPFTPQSTCNVGQSRLVVLPQTGQENDDHNPDRVKPRHVFDLAIGTDNLFHAEGRKRFTASIDVANLTNKVSLYNFLSTFSGTHFLQPRTVIGTVGFAF